MSMRNAWAPLADRGRLSLTLVTRAHLAEAGMGVDSGVELLGAVRPDDAPAFELGFPSLELAAVFVREMAPHRLEVFAGKHEDADAILAQVQHEPGATIH